MTGEFVVAVHSLVYLNKRREMLSSDALAQNVCTNPARIRKVMAKLKKAGLVKTKEGAEGGYCFYGDPASINLRQVCEAVECKPVNTTWRSGSEDMECMVASGIAGVLDELYADLNKECLRKLEEYTLADVDNRLVERLKEKNTVKR